MYKLIVLTILIVVLSGCNVTIEESKGCDRFVKRLREDCRWCEENGGKYISTGWSVECVFPPNLLK